MEIGNPIKESKTNPKPGPLVRLLLIIRMNAINPIGINKPRRQNIIFLPTFDILIEFPVIIISEALIFLLFTIIQIVCLFLLLCAIVLICPLTQLFALGQ